MTEIIQPISQELRDRITVREDVFYLPAADQPIQITYRFTNNIEMSEDLYGPRKLRIGTSWTQLDSGWIKESGMVIVKNLEGTNLQFQPTEEEMSEVMSKTIEISFQTDSGPHLIIPPREHLRFIPKELDSVFLRCTNGECRCQLYVIAR